MHLREVSEAAAEHAEAFDSGEWGRLIGWAHDLGKYQPAFQQYLLRAGGATEPVDEGIADGFDGKSKVDHSTPGAQELARSMGSQPFNLLAAWCVAGHHCGLMDHAADPPGFGYRLRKHFDPFVIPMAIRQWLHSPPLPQQMKSWSCDQDHQPFRTALWTRMLFSALVDADFLCTERFMSKDRSEHRPCRRPSMADLARRVDAYINQKAADAKSSTVHRLRQQVLAACRAAADKPAGLFTLSVPTGGGKTLSSLSFALNHCARNGLRRIVYAIPFTSIIEQNSAVFRDALGEYAEGLIEHHSNRDPDSISLREALSSENWDAAIVATTNVQLLESLFACKTSHCRKLHRLARSVIILDEAQALPVELLRATLAALKYLIEDYGCTIVLCTATQPALLWRDDFEIGLKGHTEIVGDPAAVEALFASLKRTQVRHVGTRTDDTLVAQLASHAQALCVVNTKGHCADIFDRLLTMADPDGCFHLSTHMCPAHRTQTLATIRVRLAGDLPCRVVSTSLVEAGVDLDFPVVYRAMAGLDSILQAAGRCNREGRRGICDVFVFDTDVKNRQLLQRIYATQDVIEARLQLDSLEAIERYFRIYQSRRSNHIRPTASWDDPRVMECFDYDRADRTLPWAFRFATAADRYRLIETEQTPVYIAFDEMARQMLRTLDSVADPPSRALLRRLQKYAVNLHPHSLKILLEAGRATQHASGLHLLREGDDAYDPRRGVRLGGADDPERLIL